MLSVEIPGMNPLELRFLVMDYNGALAIDGELIDGVAPRLRELSTSLEIHVITADTFGLARQALAALPVKLHIISSDKQSQQKVDYIRALGAEYTVAIGNGKNDRLMLRDAQLGIVTIQREGAFATSIQWADIVVNDINDALDLLLKPLRLKATLRD
jgi:soluble P-type ATPase